MFDYTSRYAKLETATFTTSGGETVAYVRRRFLPPGETLPLLAEVVLMPGERLDLFAFRTLGDPLAFWRIADANDAANPFDLELAATPLRVPVPQP
jgi:hypothetical protein